MDKKIVLLGIFLGCVHLSTQNHCTSTLLPEQKYWPEAVDFLCFSKLQDQVKMEFEASLTYLTMSTHFSHYANLRPGIAKFFLESAIEERFHAKKLLEYIQMRGGKVTFENMPTLAPLQTNLSSVETALESAIEMEKAVTVSIKNIISVCNAEPVMSTKVSPRESDYHAVDYLTGEFLTEQYHGIRKTLEHLTKLKRIKNYGKFAEVIFDKTLT